MLCTFFPTARATRYETPLHYPRLQSYQWLYIERFTTHRHRDSSGDDIVQDIDDVRNGLFLNAGLHRVLGNDFALLKVCLFDLMLHMVRADSFSEQTPNFAMDTTDVDPNADRAQERFTSHFFFTHSVSLARYTDSAVRVPSNMSIWPPTALFDAVYASAVLHHFGFTPTHISEKWGDVFYPGVSMTSAHR